MRIIHTSDWHLGQYFYGKSREAEHRAFFNWLLTLIKSQKVDVVIVAGDIFDTGSPPSYARELYNYLVVEMQKLNCHLVILGGNHDSVAMLNESKQLLECLNVSVIPGVQCEPKEQVVVLKDQQAQARAILCAIPYIRPRDVLTSKAGQSGQEKRANLQSAIKEHYQNIMACAQKAKETIGAELPVIATGHLTVLGVSATESVRDIYIGTLDAFPASDLPKADYIALGHIHQPQVVAKSNHIRYSGSPIPLSFDELNQQKVVLLAEFNDTSLLSVEPIDVPLFQPMAMIKGDLIEIEAALQEFGQSENEQQTKHLTWLDIEVSSVEYLTDLQKRIQQLTEQLPVEVLLLRRARKQQNHLANNSQKQTLAEISVEEVFAKRLSQEDFSSEEQQERKKRLTQSFEQTLAQLHDNDFNVEVSQ